MMMMMKLRQRHRQHRPHPSNFINFFFQNDNNFLNYKMIYVFYIK